MIDINSPQGVARIIDQTLLQPTASRNQVHRFCEEAAPLGFAAVCVAPCWVNLAATVLERTEVRICSVAGFPLGFEPVEIKVKAVNAVLGAGADEIDFVVNLGAIKGGERDVIALEMEAIRRSAENSVVKAILETGYLTQEETEWLCLLAVDHGLDFVKTSTGLGPSGATADEVRFLADCGQGRIRIKAAGGIRTLRDLRNMVAAGAHRIGTSVGREILAEAAAGGQ